MDAGIIAALKRRYRRFQYEQALDNIDAEVIDIYKVDQITAMRQIHQIWRLLPESIIWNCWVHTKLIEGERAGQQKDVDAIEIADDIQNAIRELVPNSVRRAISIDQLLNYEGEDDCIAVTNETELASAAAADILEDEHERTDLDEEPEQLNISASEKLKCLALVKRILQEEEDVGEFVFRTLRRTQRSIKKSVLDGQSQSKTTSFFSKSQ